MIKKFAYFESAEGGMITHVFNDFKNFHCYSWLLPACEKEDKALIRWAKNANIGDCFKHRLGACVRINLNTVITSD